MGAGQLRPGPPVPPVIRPDDTPAFRAALLAQWLRERSEHPERLEPYVLGLLAAVLGTLADDVADLQVRADVVRRQEIARHQARARKLGVR